MIIFMVSFFVIRLSKWIWLTIVCILYVYTSVKPQSIKPHIAAKQSAHGASLAVMPFGFSFLFYFIVRIHFSLYFVFRGGRKI